MIKTINNPKSYIMKSKLLLTLKLFMINLLIVNANSLENNPDKNNTLNQQNSVTYTQLPDANFEAALVDLGIDTVANDGQVLTANIAGITTLDLNNRGISDLTGINDFIALESLKLQYNNLTTLNVSNLVNLRILWAANGNVFSSIDVSNNINLEDFRLRQYSGATIDLSANTALTRFACEGCDLTSLDTSNNVNLNYLYLWNSDIVYLDLSTNINLETLNVYSTNLTALDVSQNVLLKSLIANDITTLTSLNIQNGANTNITGFNTSGTLVSCILVDDAAYSTTNWINIDGASTFSDTYCDYTIIPDANFEAELDALGYDDISGDGQVPTSLIEVVTVLNVSNKNISDLTGIQDFLALETLECQSNNLTALNVSNNTALVALTANANNIESIDISQNSGLETLIIGANDLTVLDISNNTLLKRLDVLYNDITVIDTSNNPALVSLNAYNTNITSYDFSNNPLLENVQVYNNNALTALDVSNLTQLDQLRINNTGVSALDLSHNPNLRIIRASDSNIESLDLSFQTDLIHVYVDNTPIHYLNVKNGNNTNFTQFHADGTPNLNCIIVDDAIYSTTNWTIVDTGMVFSSTYCDYTAISDANFEAALNALGYDDIASDGQVPTALIEVVATLDVSNQSISDLTGIEAFTALANLNVETNSLTNLDVSNNSNLQILNFDNNSIASLNLGAISGLTSIEGRYNQLSTIDLSQNSNLTFINLRNNLFTTFDVSNNPILDTLNLRGCTSLNTLDLTNNPSIRYIYMQDTALTALDFTNNTLLEVVVIERCNFSTIDVSNLTALRELRVPDNNITELDVSNNTALTRLECENNSLLTSLNMVNGNNTNISNGDFIATNNPLLSCVKVDDAIWSTTNWTNIDATTGFSDTYCRYTNILDPVFETRLGTLGYDDVNGDGKVPTALIEEVTDLFILSFDLSDLTGIEDFLALETLSCSGGSLTSVDLSNNTQLRAVNFSNNNINTLDVSNSLALEELELRGNNLSSINVSNNVALKVLNLSGNNITSLNVSNSPLLDDLDVSGNNLTSLDLTHNTALLELNLEGLNLTTIDLSTNTLLQELNASYTTLTDLNLANNTAITYLECLESHQLTTLDISTLVALEDVYLSDNDLLSELNIKNGNNTNVATFEVEGVPNLTCILVDDAVYSTANWTDVDETVTFRDGDYCRYTAIPDPIFEAELEALGYDDISGDAQVPTVLIEAITSLALPNKGINDLTGIQDFVGLTSLNCRVNNLTALDISQNVLLTTLTADTNNITAIDLSNNINLQILNLGGNDLTSIDVSDNMLLRKFFLNGNQGLTSLDISNNIELVELRTFSTNITTLNLSTHPDLESLESYNSPLASIDVSNNPLLELLRVENTNITALDLTNNPNIRSLRVNDTAIESLDLSNQTNLQTLYAHDTSLNSLNVKNGNNTNVTIFRAENNPNLDCILVDDAVYSAVNWTDVDGIVTFRDGDYCRYTAIPDATFEARLESLGYDDVSLDGQVPTALIEAVTSLTINDLGINDPTGIEDFTALVTLNARGNNFTSLDVSQNTLLQHLYINANNLSSIDVSNNTVLRNLNIGSNSITSLDLSNNPDLRDLWVQGNGGLTTLDLSNNLDLRELYTYSSGVSTLDLSIHTELRILSAYRTSIASIDLSNNVELKLLRLDETNMTALDLTNNTKLETLRINDTEFTSLDLSHQTSLVKLWAHDTSLNYLNVKNGNNTNVTTFITSNNPSLACILVDDAVYSTTNWTDIDATSSFNDISCHVDYDVSIKAYLQGALLNPNVGEETLMRDDLRMANLIPENSPYIDGLTCNTSVFNTVGNNAIVDWVFVELRDKNDNTLISYSQSALLQRDGDIVDVDGISPLTFSATSNTFYIAIKHRNHLGIMTYSTVSLSSSTSTNIDFTDVNNPITSGTNAQTTFGMSNDIIAMWAGDVNGDGMVQYTGGNADTPNILAKVLSAPENFLGFSTFTINGYLLSDIDMDGNIQYTGGNADAPYILQNILAHPQNFLGFATYLINTQLP